MYKLCRNLAFAVLLTGMMAQPALFAQTTYSERHDVNNRRNNEQSRIQQGERSGQITQNGANKLEGHQQAIHNQEHADRASDGGHLTAKDRHQLAREQNRQSQRVYRDKHNAVTQPGVPPR